MRSTRRSNATDLPSVILPAGSKLFHGSIEKIKGRLRPGGDHVLWFADSPVVAQLYLSRSGMPATYEEFAYGRKQTKAWPHDEPLCFGELLKQANPAPRLHRLASCLAQGG